jgi:hypothetical protein
VPNTGSIGERTSTTQNDKAVSAKLLEKQPRNPQVAVVGNSSSGKGRLRGLVAKN